MNPLHLLRIPVRVPQLLRFAAEHGITSPDETLGYTLHAWFAALFGDAAPKPFRCFERRQEVLAYANTDATTLLQHAQTFASPLAWAALDAQGVASKPMPHAWQPGQRVRVEVLTCPVARHGDEEKDVYLRALDRMGDAAPTRSEVYSAWFIRQWAGAAQLEDIELLGMQAQSPLLRRDRSLEQNRLRRVQRPQALFTANATVEDGNRFAVLLTRGIGRHRAFGFGMVLLAPPQ